MSAIAHHYHDDGMDLQVPFDAAVIMPSILRPTLGQAMRSVFTQKFAGTIQFLLGIDKAEGDRTMLAPILAERPSNCVVTVLDLGYSTAERHGGIHRDEAGGALRTILSYIANSRYLAYLDDDNWFAEDHLSSLRAAIRGVDWAWSLRWFVDWNSGEPQCVDEWESVGPGKGVFAERFGGWVDPNCLMIRKPECEPVLAAWSLPLSANADQVPADRRVFRALKERYRGAATGKATTFYRMRPGDFNHPNRLRAIRAKRNAA